MAETVCSCGCNKPKPVVLSEIMHQAEAFSEETQRFRKIYKAFNDCYPHIPQPVFEGEDGDFFGFGHMDYQDFLAAVRQIIEENGTDDEYYEDFEKNFIDYRWAKLGRECTLEDSSEDFYFIFCEKSDTGAFPVTYM